MVVIFEPNETKMTCVPPTPQLCPSPISNEEIKKAKEVFDHILK
jgi:hypothetical protein